MVLCAILGTGLSSAVKVDIKYGDMVSDEIVLNNFGKSWKFKGRNGRLKCMLFGTREGPLMLTYNKNGVVTEKNIYDYISNGTIIRETAN